jgi:soluble lytic murein transglycosylase
VLVRFAIVALLFLAGSDPASPPLPEEGTPWVEGVRADRHEAALRDLWAAQAKAPPATAAAALEAFSQENSNTRASGVARLGAGLILLDADKPQDAISHLKHRDVARTTLFDHATLALARAYEKTGDFQLSARSYREAAEGSPSVSIRCAALLRGAEVQSLVGQQDTAMVMLDRALGECPGREPQALRQKATVLEKSGDLKGAAEILDRLDSDYATSIPAKETTARRRALAPHLPPLSPAARNARDLKKAMALFDDHQYSQALPLLRALALRPLAPPDSDLVRVRLGRALLETGKDKEAQTILVTVPAGSAHGGEAAYFLARIQARRARTPFAYQSVLNKYPTSPWAEESLLNLAHHYLKDGKDAQALPYFQRLYDQFPEGRLVERATWRVGWAEFEKGRFTEAADIWIRGARTRPTTSYTGAFLYWSGRARRETGRDDEARKLFEETIQRFKYAYHGLRAREALGRLPGGSSSTHPATDPVSELTEPYRTRVHDLLMLDRYEQATDEMRGAPPSPQTRATLAFIQWKQGHLRPAITAMKHAYPEHVTELGDQLPEPVWRILHPIQFAETITLRSAQVGLDPGLVAALICQESTFDPTAMSAVGARGLMQLMPRTGRELARANKIPFGADALHDPHSSLQLGTHYLRQMVKAFGGRVERALAAYNAGPHRVSIWTAGRRNMSAEEFVDYIPYPETRLYVMTILAAQEQYRRIYSLPHAGALTLVAQQGAAPPGLASMNAPQPAFRPAPPPMAQVVPAKAKGKGKAVTKTAAPRRAPAGKKIQKAPVSKRTKAPKKTTPARRTRRSR